MKEAATDQLGAPAIRLAGFQLWVHGRQFPDSQDCWDGNWLNVTAHCDAAKGSVWALGGRSGDLLADYYRSFDPDPDAGAG